jgi:hypothetical protein
MVETRESLTKEKGLQAAFKAINNTAGSNRLVPTLLVFKAYLKINADLLPTLE